MKTTHLKRKGFVVAIRDSERSERPHFQVDTTVGRKRIRKTFGSFQKAQTHAEHLLSCLTSGRPDLTLLDPAVVSLLSKIPTSDQVGFLQNVLLVKGSAQTPTKPSLADVTAAFKQSLINNGSSDRHLATIRSHSNRLATTTLVARPIDEITTDELDKNLQEIKCLRTRLNHRITFVSIFNFAKRKGLLPEDKLTAAERTERPNIKTSEPEIFTPEELQRLLRVAYSMSPAATVFLLLGAFAGIRAAEILRMTLSCWDPVEGTLSLGPEITKTNRRRTIVVEPILAKWFNDTNLIVGKLPGDLLVSGLSNINRTLRNIADKAGVAWKHNALRHSCLSYALAKHNDLAVTSKNAGHSPRILETVYLKLTSATSAERWFSIAPVTNAI